MDEYDERWYILIGSPLILGILMQILTPHLGLIYEFMISGCRRCHDRKYTTDKRVTRKVIQSDYEDLYTGPKFQLQIRLAQLVSTVFVAMTFSSGLPIMYVICFVSLFITYWVDKILLLRYYRITEGYNKHLSEAIVSTLPFALLFHIFFGYFMLSSPNFLASQPFSPYFGSTG